jgi:hypothetical protein
MKGHNYGPLCMKCGKTHQHGLVTWRAGQHASEETKKKISLALTGLKRTEEQKKNCRSAAKRRRSFSGAGNPNYGKTHPHTEETKEKIRLGNTGHKRTDEQKEHYRNSFTEERRKKLSIQRKRYYKDHPAKRKEMGYKSSKILKGRTNKYKGKTYAEIMGSEEKALERKRKTSEWMKTDNIVHRPGAKEKMRLSKREYYKSHPEKHPNSILCGSRGYSARISKPQQEMFSLLQQVFPDCELNFPIIVERGTRFVDVISPSKLLGFEYDEPYWHKDSIRDIKRRTEIEKVGIDIISFRNIEEVKTWLFQYRKNLSAHRGRGQPQA